MYEEKDEEGISLLDLLKVAFGRKILLLIITLSITLIGVLFVKFYYNKNKNQYYVNYEYVLPGIEENKLIDDSKFNYQMLISYDSLKSIKESNSEFSSINIDNLVNKDGINIYCDEVRNQSTGIVESRNYKIVANVKYFKNDKQANYFIHEVANQPYNKTLLLLDIIKYDSFLDNYNESNVYDTQIQCLIKQKDLLINQYNELIDRYGDVSLSDGKKISYYLTELKIFFVENDVDSLLSEVEEYGYIKDSGSYKKELEYTKIKLESEKKLNISKIDSLQAEIKKISDNASNIQAADLASYNEKIALLAIENAEIDKDLKVIEKKLADHDDSYKERKNAFDIRMANYYSSMTNFTNDFSNVYKEVVSEGSYVSYNNNSIKIQGGIKILIAGPALLVLGCFIGCIVNICLDHKKLSKKEEKEIVENN